MSQVLDLINVLVDRDLQQLRQKLRQTDEILLRGYLRDSATDLSAKSQVIKLLVTQTINANAAERRRAAK
jgi:hypothetical protein